MKTILFCLVLCTNFAFGQFPNPLTLSTGQGVPGTLDPIWTCSPWIATMPTDPNAYTYSPTLINNNCAPGNWITPATLPPPLNLGNWITGAESSCADNVTAGYRFFRLTLNLPPDCAGASVTHEGNYVLNFDGYVDNFMHNVFVNGAPQGISGGGFSPGSQTNIYLDGPWQVGVNYIDILIENAPNPGGGGNPYGLLLVANAANLTTDSDGDGIADALDVCPCEAGTNAVGCNENFANGCDIEMIRNTFLNAGCIEMPTCYSECSMYFLNPQGLSGSVAQAYAQTFGANLISIQDGAENACIMNELNRLGQSGIIWIGFNDEASEGTFTWYDQSQITYTNWDGGEPNNTNGVEDCVQIYPNGQWNDLNCANSNVKSVIEVNLCPVIDVPPVIVCENQPVTLTPTNPILGSFPYTYEWSSGQTTAVINPPAVSQQYVLTVRDRYNCEVKDTTTVTVKPLATFGLQPISICALDTVNVPLISSLPNTTITHTNNLASPLTQTVLGTNNHIISVVDNSSANSVVYNYVVNSNADGCTNSETFQVTVYARPNLQLTTTDNAICLGSSTTIAAQGLANYSWTPENLVDNPTGTSITTAPPQTTYFVVSGVTNDGCADTDSIQIIVNPITPVEAGPDQALCYGDPTTLTAISTDPLTQFVWTSNVVNGVEFVPYASNMYLVTATDGNGCVATDSVYILVRSLPLVDAGPAIYSCNGYPITLAGTGAGFNGVYTWDNNVVDNQSFPASIGVSYFHVVGVDQFGCQNTDSVLVNVEDFPTIVMSASQSGYCYPVDVVFTNGTPNVQNCVWTIDGSLPINDCQSPTIIFNQAGIFGATLYVESPNGCPSTLSQDSMVIIDEYPTAHFSIKPSETSIIDPEYDFINHTVNGVTYLWDFDYNGSTSVQSNPSFVYPEIADSYSVLLIAYSENGCIDSIRKNVRIKDELIFYIPNAFTPDGNEFNNHFFPVFTTGYDPQDYKLLLFNRWGETIFESNDVTVGWDGTYGGKIMEMGTYSWKIEVKTTMSDERKSFSGHVILLK